MNICRQIKLQQQLLDQEQQKAEDKRNEAGIKAGIQLSHSVLNKLAKDPMIVVTIDRILARVLSPYFDEIEDQWRRDLLMEDELARVILGGPIPSSFESG